MQLRATAPYLIKQQYHGNTDANARHARPHPPLAAPAVATYGTTDDPHSARARRRAGSRAPRPA
eukprot:COSAG02_NODE_2644_length_8343_cov_16.256308_7_plen_64_part_00